MNQKRQHGVTMIIMMSYVYLDAQIISPNGDGLSQFYESLYNYNKTIEKFFATK